MDTIERAWNELSSGLVSAGDERMLLLLAWVALLAAVTVVAILAMRRGSRFLALALGYAMSFWMFREHLVTVALVERNWQLSAGVAALAAVAAWLACRRSAI